MSAQEIPEDLSQIAFEDLMKMEVVSVSKREQPLSRTAAAVYVITREDIARSGAATIPDLLRGVPGIQVARINSNSWVVTARGFSSSFANKMLVLVDGRSVYQPLYSGVYWDTQDLPMDDVERIEVIRGPGATTWGANAVNGVINIITRSSADTKGALVTTSVMQDNRREVAARYGAALGQKAAFRIYGKHRSADGLFYGDGRASEDWNVSRWGFRADWMAGERDTLLLEGDVYSGRAVESTWKWALTPPYGAEVRTPSDLAGWNLVASWAHSFSDRSDINLQLSVDHYSRLGEPQQTLNQDLTAVDLDFQHRYALTPRHELIWGAGARTTRGVLSGGHLLGFADNNVSLGLYSGFIQDEIALVPERLSLTLGVKLERNDLTGLEYQPNARLAWQPNKATQLWASVGRAVRTPSWGERFGVGDIATIATPSGLPMLVNMSGSPNFRSETLVAYEAGYRVQPSASVSFDFAGFYNLYRHLLTTEAGQPRLAQRDGFPYLFAPVSFENQMDARGYGLEVSAKWKTARRWKNSFTYSWLSLDARPYATSTSELYQFEEGCDPEHQVAVQSSVDITRRMGFDMSVYRVGALPTLNVPAYTRVDAHFSWGPARHLKAEFGAANLGGAQIAEYIPSRESLAAPMYERGRRLYVRLRWQF